MLVGPLPALERAPRARRTLSPTTMVARLRLGEHLSELRRLPELQVGPAPGARRAWRRPERRATHCATRARSYSRRGTTIPSPSCSPRRSSLDHGRGKRDDRDPRLNRASSSWPGPRRSPSSGPVGALPRRPMSPRGSTHSPFDQLFDPGLPFAGLRGSSPDVVGSSAAASSTPRSARTAKGPKLRRGHHRRPARGDRRRAQAREGRVRSRPAREDAYSLGNDVTPARTTFRRTAVSSGSRCELQGARRARHPSRERLLDDRLGTGLMRPARNGCGNSSLLRPSPSP